MAAFSRGDYVRALAGKPTRCYRIPYMHYHGQVISSNSPVSGAFRSWSAAEEALMMERQLDAAAEKLAGQIAGNAPIAVRASKQAINDGLQVDIDRAVVIEEKAFGSCFQSADQQEGMGAFLEKRKHEPFINK